MALPEDQTKRDTIKAYAGEYLQYLRDEAAIKLKQKEVEEAIKESEDYLDGYSVKEFKALVTTAYRYEKTQEKSDALTNAIESVDILKL